MLFICPVTQSPCSHPRNERQEERAEQHHSDADGPLAHVRFNAIETGLGRRPLSDVLKQEKDAWLAHSVAIELFLNRLDQVCHAGGDRVVLVEAWQLGDVLVAFPEGAIGEHRRHRRLVHWSVGSAVRLES